VRLLLLGGALVMLGLVAGCGSTATAAPVQTDQVNLPPSYRFDPAVIQVVAGTSVTWTNNDHFTHSVKVQDASDHVIKPGESVSILFDTPGSYSYLCTFHTKDMKGTVIVANS
jgi:plastocyanin